MNECVLYTTLRDFNVRLTLLEVQTSMTRIFFRTKNIVEYYACKNISGFLLYHLCCGPIS